MSVTIIIFQLIIVISLIVTRIFYPKNLTTLAMGWSALTVIFVFMPWLMALQLLIIWGSFFLLSPKDAHFHKSEPTEKIPMSPAKAAPTTPSGTSALFSPQQQRSAAKGDHGDTLARFISWMEAVQSLDAAISFEENLVNSAVARTQRRLETAAFIGQDVIRKSKYEKHYKRLEDALSAADSGAKPRVAETNQRITPAPDFEAIWLLIDKNVNSLRSYDVKRREEGRAKRLRASLESLDIAKEGHLIFWKTLESYGEPLIYNELRAFAKREGLL